MPHTRCRLLITALLLFLGLLLAGCILYAARAKPAIPLHATLLML